MQTKPTNWDTYLSVPHRVESRMVIGNNTYDHTTIKSLHTSSALYESFGIGNCVSASCTVEFYPTTAPASQASIQISCRLKRISDSAVTDYLNRGTFFISKRQTNRKTGTLTLTCYDAMLKAEGVYLTPSMSLDTWPKDPSTVVNEIALRMFGEAGHVDSRNSYNSSFKIPYPVDEDGDMTMRQVLSRIAIANAGNWIINEDNQLRLVPLASNATPLPIQLKCLSLDKGIISAAITQVEILNNSGEVLAVSGNTTGKTLTVTHPDGNQAMADYILSKVQNYVQSGYEAEAATLDPAAELGDRVTIGSSQDLITSVVASRDTNFDVLCASDIGAPDADEIEDEYPYASYEQKIERKIATTFAKIAKTDRDIQLLVQGLVDPWVSGTEYHVGDLVSKEGKFYKCIVANSDTIWTPSHWDNVPSGVVESLLQLAVGKMTLSVSDSESGSSIVLTSGDIHIQSPATYFDTNEAHFSGTLSGEKITANTSISAPTIYAQEGAEGGYIRMTNGGFDVYNAAGLLKARLGYTSGATDYPFLQLGAGSDRPGTKGLIKKFSNGLWLGNDVNENEDGTFTPQEGCHGLFCDFSNGEVYVVNDTDATEIFIGQAVARFG